MHHPTDRIRHTTAFVTPVMEHWLFRLEFNGRKKEGSVLFNDALNTFSYGYMASDTNKIAHTTAFVTPVVEHWMERDIAQSIRRPIVP